MHYRQDPKGRVEIFDLAKMSKPFNLPPKLDSGMMKYRIVEEFDITNMLVYNTRNSDLHAWLAKNMLMCECIYMFAGSSRSTLRDSVANNTGVITFYLI